jgi:hypothetical protein
MIKKISVVLIGFILIGLTGTTHGANFGVQGVTKNADGQWVKENPAGNWGFSSEDWKKRQVAARLAQKQAAASGALTTKKAQPAAPAKPMAPAPAPKEKPTITQLNQAITQCEAILTTEAVSVRSQATIAGAMRAVALKINLGTIDSVASFNDLFMQIVNFTLQLQKRVAELGNTQSVGGGALASIVAARNAQGTQKNDDWRIFIEEVMPLITAPVFKEANSFRMIIANASDLAEKLFEAITHLKDSTGLLTDNAKKSLLFILGAYQNTLETFATTLKDADLKVSESEQVATAISGATYIAKMALNLGGSYLIKQATAGILDIDLDPLKTFGKTIDLAYDVGEQLGKEYISHAAERLMTETAKKHAFSAAISGIADVPLESLRTRAESSMRESEFETEEKIAAAQQHIEQAKIVNQILDNETILCKMYAEITKGIAEDIVKKLQMHVEDPNEGYEFGSSECTYEFHVLFNSLITLSEHIAGFAHANTAAGIAILNIMKEQQLAGHNNRERFNIFAQTIVPLFKKLPEPLGSQIEYATMVRFKNYEEQLAKAEGFFVFTPTERASGTLLKDDILSKEAVNRLTTVIRSYRAAIFALTRTFDQIKEALPGPRGTWWRAIQYVTGSRVFSIGKSVTLTFALTAAVASMATPAGWGAYLFLYLPMTYVIQPIVLPAIAEYGIGLAGSGAKKLISPRTKAQGDVAAEIMMREEEQEEARKARREQLKSIPAFREKFEREKQPKATPAPSAAQS